MNGLLVVTLLVHGLYAALEVVTATDLWWAMATGRYIVAHRAVPAADMFSFTYEGAPWFNQEWLSQVLFYELFRHGGGATLALFKVLLVVGFFLLAGWIGWRRSGSLLLAVVPAAAAAFVCRPYLDIRPQLFMFAGTLVLMALVDTYRQVARPVALLLLPLTLALWVNLHFSFIYGLGVLLLVAGAETVQAALRPATALMPLPRALRLAAAAGVAVLACLLNPQGWHALVFPFSILGTEELWRKEIVEWVPPVFFRQEPFNPVFFGYYFVAQVVLALAALIAAPRRFDIASLLHVAVTAAMALSARRFVPLFALVSAPFASANLALLWSRVPAAGEARAERWRTPWAAAVAGGCLLALGYVIIPSVPEVRRQYASGLFEGMTDDWYFPKAAVEFLDRNPLPGRLFHIYTWGGYIMYGAPGRKVFIDGRGHTVYPAAFYSENTSAEYGYEGWGAVLDRWQVSLILWPSSNTAGGRYKIFLDAVRRSPSWQVVYDDRHSVVFAHIERGRAWIDAYRALALEYPDALPAQLFLADTYFAARQFERARRHLQDVLARSGERQQAPSSAEQKLLESAQATNAPDLWFRVAFYRDVRNDVAAAEAYRNALERGLGEPYAGYAREAIARLADERAAP